MNMKPAAIPLAAIPLIFSVAMAHALIIIVPPPPPDVLTTYEWTGICMDCTDPLGAPSDASATLVLRNYDFGIVSTSNFTSFHYHSAKFDDLSTDLASQVRVLSSASLPSAPGGAGDFTLEWIFTTISTTYTFSTFLDGHWDLSTADSSADFGVNSNFALASEAPEPASLALLGLGLAGLGFSRRKSVSA